VIIRPIPRPIYESSEDIGREERPLAVRLFTGTYPGATRGGDAAPIGRPEVVQPTETTVDGAYARPARRDATRRSETSAPATSDRGPSLLVQAVGHGMRWTGVVPHGALSQHNTTAKGGAPPPPAPYALREGEGRGYSLPPTLVRDAAREERGVGQIPPSQWYIAFEAGIAPRSGPGS